jgi:AraC-like DNA-binding protein
VSGRHGLRLVAAPLGFDETGFLPYPVEFAGQSFSDEQPVTARYRFNSWRVTYRYRFDRPSGWQVWAGVTAKVRDAEIRLIQGDTVGLDDDTGFVPLLYLAARYRFSDRWSFDGDFDGLAGGPGRAIDLSFRFNYLISERWSLGIGYRGLDEPITDIAFALGYANASNFTRAFKVRNGLSPQQFRQRVTSDRSSSQRH